MDAQTALLKQMVALLARQPPEPPVLRVVEAEKPLGNNLGTQFPTVPKLVATPSKAELARQWFREHPADLKKPGRELEQSVQPQGVQISYKYWNKIKKEMQ